jgi:hypothetical protein
MAKILQSTEVNSIESIIHNSLKRMIENGTHMHYVARFTQRFEEELNFELMQQHNEKERNNLKETLRVIKGISIKNLSVNK